MGFIQRRIGASQLCTLLGPRGDTPAYAWLAGEIRALICDGRLLPGTQLPSERDLLAALGLSRTTVSRAYAELRDRGCAEAVQGSGTTVRLPGERCERGGGEPLLHCGGDHGDGDELSDDVIDLRSAAPSAPAGLTAAYAAALERLPAFASRQGYYPHGLPELRERIAHRYTERGLATSAQQIIVTAGALGGLATVFDGAFAARSRVVIESPTYPNSVLAMQRSGIVPLQIPTDAETGCDDQLLGEALRSATGMVLMPDFHNPTGHLLNESQRVRIAELWAKHKTLGVIDETVAELWIDEPPTALPMAAYAPEAITVGSASKTYWGGLRLGWIRAGRSHRPGLDRARLGHDLGTPVLEQLVLAELMDKTPKLTANDRDSLRERRDTLLRLRDLGWTCVTPNGGLQLWWRLPGGDSGAFVEQAAAHGVQLVPGSTFAVDGRSLSGYLRTPFALDAAQLREAVSRMFAAWSQLHPQGDALRAG